MTICPSGAAPTVSGPGAASTRPARVRGAFAGPGVPRGPIVATRTPCPPGQSAEASHTTAPAPVACSGLSLGKTTCGAPLAGQALRVAGVDQ